MWKYLDHPNILPFLGAALDPTHLVSGLVRGGDLSKYLQKYPNVDRVKLVGIPPPL